jgi:hypothetical protein
MAERQRMTNILSIPQLPAWEFVIATGSDFRDAIQFLADASVDPAVPLAITGVDFEAKIRSAVDNEDILLEASTGASTMTVDGPAGTLSFAIPAASCSKLEVGEAVCDIIASADGARVNLCKDNGPLKITIRAGLA